MSFSLLIVAILLGLLLLVLLARVASQGLLKDLENLLVFNLLIRLELAQVQGRRSAELSDTILGDS